MKHKPYIISVLFLISACVLAGVIFYYARSSHQANEIRDSEPGVQLGANEYSGWVPYWKEQQAHELMQTTDMIHTASPVWFLVNKEFTLDEVGTMRKEDFVAELHQRHIVITATIASDIRGEGLSPLFRDPDKINRLITEIIERASSLHVDGIDLDLEHITIADKDVYVSFIEQLAKASKERNLKFTISAHAQTGTTKDWSGVQGQNLAAIGRIADEVRIMTYDYHGPDSEPGAIAPLFWLHDVIQYTLTQVPRSKIVIGIPTYGYLWDNGSTDPEPLEYDDFQAIMNDRAFSNRRDHESQEIVYTSRRQTAWISDNQAIEAKIATARSLGLNKFIFWNLGSMDKEFFEGK